MDFKLWIESSLNDLYNSAVEAFPRTEFRQHSTDSIKIAQLSIIPFKGLKTLFFKGLANNEGRNYNSIILFKKVDFVKNGIPIITNDGGVVQIKPLSLENHDVAVRCDCLDFQYRFCHYNNLDKSLYGRDRKKYESKGGPAANPKEMEGVCKHLIKLSSALVDAGILHN